MKLHAALRLLAGLMVLLSLVLGLTLHRAFFFLTGFVALNLIQSAFTNACPAMTLMRKMGIKE